MFSFVDGLYQDLYAHGPRRAGRTGVPTLGQSSKCSLVITVFWNYVSEL
jgi:hypothetical protein